jgi:membrane-bound inhibitor of C-type lysozyme
MQKMMLIGAAALTLSACQSVGGPGVSTYMECTSGLRLKIDNLGSEMVLVSVNGQRPVALRQVPSGSGALYEGRGYRLHNKGNEAIWSGLTREAPHQCRTVAVPR